MCAALGSYVFDHGDKGVVDQVKITWEKPTNHVAILYGTDIGTELATNARIQIPKSTYSQQDIDRHDKVEIIRKDMATLLKDALVNEVSRLEDRIKMATRVNINVSSDPYLLVEKQNKIKLLQLEIDNDQPIQLRGKSKTEYNANLKLYKSEVQAMEKYCGQAFSMIQSTCTLALETKMK
jgi:NAD+--asparagine ADP-ribosyltransferase